MTTHPVEVSTQPPPGRIMYVPQIFDLLEIDRSVVLHPDLDDGERSEIKRRLNLGLLSPLHHILFGLLSWAAVVGVIASFAAPKWFASIPKTDVWLSCLVWVVVFVPVSLLRDWLFYRSRHDRVIRLRDASSSPSFESAFARVRVVEALHDSGAVTDGELSRVAWLVWETAAAHPGSQKGVDWSPVSDVCGELVSSASDGE